MAMNKDVLGKAIAKRIVDSDAPADMKKKVEDLWIEIAGEIIDHIKSNAEISVQVGDSLGSTISTGTGKVTG